MSWCATEPGFSLTLFLDHLRATKPPYFCPYPECDNKKFKTFQGIQTHLSKNHTEDYEKSQAPVEEPATPGLDTSGGLISQRGVPWTQAMKIVEVDYEGTLWRLNILEPIEISCKKDSELSPDKRSHAVLEAYRKAITIPEKLPEPKFSESKNVLDMSPKSPWELPNHYVRHIERSPDQMDQEVEYDMDEEDYAWLEVMNKEREEQRVSKVPESTFEFLMDRLEKESHFQSSQTTQEKTSRPPIDEDAVCCVCQDGECQNTNVILFCDMCNLAVHQECYGIPYIPEGQWLCRRCQLSPSVAVSCCLCPNSGGAFKRTSDGQWAHVICAIWVPEVHFANTVFLEPVEGMETVPAARWKLKCIVCQQRGVGACIQCHKPSCYTAFHVTCAQSAGVYMRVEPCRDASPGGTPFGVRKFIYCDIHAPGSSRAPSEEGSKTGSENGVVGAVKGSLAVTPKNGREESLQARKQLSQKKMRQARKILAQNRNSAPNVSIPVIPKQRLDAVANQVKVASKQIFLRRLVAYWTLKRESRFGVPLLRRLQCAQQSKAAERKGDEKQETKEVREQLKAWRRIRQDLEKARLLCELLRKRERLKLEYTTTLAELVDRYIKPKHSKYSETVEKLREKDRFGVFAFPVSEEEVPGYRNVIKNPMDLDTMRKKAEKGQYKTWDALQADFKLMILNCIKFNKNTHFYVKYAQRMQRMGYRLINAARKEDTEGEESNETKDNSGSDMKNLLNSLQIALLQAKDESFPWPSRNSLKSPTPSLEESPAKVLKIEKESPSKVSVEENDSPVSVVKSPLKSPAPEKTPPKISPTLKKGKNSPSKEYPHSSSSKERTFSNPEERTPKVTAKRKQAGKGKAEVEKKKSKSVKETPDASMKQTSIFDFIKNNLNVDAESQKERKTEESSPKRKLSSKPAFQQFRSFCPQSPSSADSTVEESQSEFEEDKARNSKDKRNKKGVPSVQQHPKLSDIKDEEMDEMLMPEPLDLVWAPHPSKQIEVPALVIDPKMPKTGFLNGEFRIAAPPPDVLKDEPPGKEDHYLVRFFDPSRTWAWIPMNSLAFFSLEENVDIEKMKLAKTKAEKSFARAAFNRATYYRCKTAEEDMPSAVRDWVNKNLKHDSDLFS